MPDEETVREVIQGHREQIDALDVQIVELLNKRAKESLVIRALKPQAKMGLFDPKREEEILELLWEHNDGPLYNEDIRAIYTVILKVMKEVQA